MKACLPVFDRLVPIHQRQLGRQLRQRCRMPSKGRHDGGRAEQKMVLRIGSLTTAQGAAHLAPLDSDSLVHLDILHHKPRNERSKAVQDLVVVCHANDPGRETGGSMAHQAVEVQRPVAVENHHHSTFWPLNKQFQCPFDESVFGLHAIHAVAE